METITVAPWWTGPDTGPFAVWVADRAAAEPTHCVRVAAVGRDPSGRLVVRAESLRGTRLPDALDQIGVPTVGVAVTLTVPLVELAVQGRSGSVVLGDARPDDVLVDDAGATVLVDHPPGADEPADEPAIGPPWTAGTRAPAAQRAAAERRGTGGPGGAAAPRAGSTRPSETAGASALLFAVRSVWDRVDPREPCRAAVDQAIAAALDGGVPDVLRLLEVVRATGPPRPVRWELPADDFDFAPPTPASTPGLAGMLRRVVEEGVQLPGGSRIAPRTLVVAGVVAAGVVAAATFAIPAT